MLSQDVSLSRSAQLELEGLSTAWSKMLELLMLRMLLTYRLAPGLTWQTC